MAKAIKNQFPRSLKSLAKKLPNPYKVAMVMAAEEILKLRKENAKLRRQGR